jgi:hypothetical protein
MNAAAFVAALGAAASFAVGSALEQHAAKKEKTAKPLDPRLLIRLLRRPMWLVGWIPEALGTGLQALALRLGPLALVEPLLVSGLFLAIPLEATLSRRRAHPRDFVAVAVGAAGLTAFLVAAAPQPGVAQPSLAGWLGVALWAGPALVACLAIAWNYRGAMRGALLGIATGLLYGIGASLLKALADKLATDPISVLTTWQIYALVIVGLGGVILNQDAFQSGRLAVPLTAITIIDPFVSVMIGVTAFHERLSTDGPRLTIELVAVVAMALGIWLGCTCRERSRQRQADRDRQMARDR